MFQSEKTFKMASTFVKNVFLKTDSFFAKKLHILYILDHKICFNFRQHVVQIRIKYVWRDFRLPVSVFEETVAWKSFNGKFIAKVDFTIG